MNNATFSVLMSVYLNDKPEHLDRALQSLVNQTVRPTEIVMVKDGPITLRLEAIIERYSERMNIKVVALESNVGLGQALRAGLPQCTSEIVARMDSDDICDPKRFAKQLDYMRAHPEIDVVGTWISEFDEDESNVYAYRKLPIDPAELLRFAKSRVPVNHVSVLFKKQAVLDAGGYSNMRGLEDYPLWGRMLVKGYKFANIPEYLVNVRAGKDMINRRGGIGYLISEIKMQIDFLKLGFINIIEFAINILVRFGLRLMPNRLRRYVYLKAFRCG